MSTPTGTVHLHRILTAPPHKVYRAFTEADALVRWMPPNGFTAQVHHLDVRVGGSFKMAFTNFTSGQTLSFGGEYLAVIPNVQLHYTDRFDDPHFPGDIEVHVTLKAVPVGTELTIIQSGIPEAIPLHACYLGWQDSLRHLADLVEPHNDAG